MIAGKCLCGKCAMNHPGFRLAMTCARKVVGLYGVKISIGQTLYRRFASVRSSDLKSGCAIETSSSIV